MSSFLAGALMMTFLAPASMCACAFSGVGEDARALEHDVDAQVAPRERGGILLGQDLDLAAVDDDRRVAGPDVARVGAVGRVVLEQEGVHLGVDQVVDRDDLDVGGTLDERLERLPTDPAEAVDADAGGHDAGPPGRAARRDRAPSAKRCRSDGTWRSDGGAASVCRGSTRIVRRGHRTKGGVAPSGRPETRQGPRRRRGPCTSLGGGGVSRRCGRPSAADRAGALDRRLAVLHRDLLGVLDFDLLLVLDAIGLGHVGSS